MDAQGSKRGTLLTVRKEARNAALSIGSLG
jgi:hypothetical protein